MNTSFPVEVQHDRQFVAYAAGMATSFIQRLDTGRHLTPDELDWLCMASCHSVASYTSVYKMCRELQEAYTIQQVTEALDK